MPDDTRPPARQLPDRVTMPLLTLITQQSMDEDYLHVAERRVSGGSVRPPGGSHRVAAVVIAVFGIMVTTAAVQTSRNADIDDASRDTLVSQITERRDSVSRLQDRIVEQRQQNVELDDLGRQLALTEEASTARLRRLEVRTGFVAVTGQGVRVVVDDAPDGDETQRVRDTDLRVLVDGLWQAGAEAISINGERLTVLTAISHTNVAINVNSQRLSPPYTLLAIGNAQTLQANLLQNGSGQEWYNLVRQLGFVFDMDNEDSLSLPAARMRPLRSVVSGTAEENRDKHMNEETKP